MKKKIWDYAGGFGIEKKIVNFPRFEHKEPILIFFLMGKNAGIRIKNVFTRKVCFSSLN